MSEELIQKARKIIKVLQQHSYEAYIVGGAVRDHLLGREIADVDIATSALPEEVIQIFDKVFPTGIKHGTVLVRLEEQSFEVTTYRQESDYADFRHPNQVKFVTNIKEDLSRRDFTINAMAMNDGFSIYDPYKGQLDLENRLIRTVGNPNERFSEDPLRMMRAVRFSSQLGFTIEDITIDAMEKNAHLLSHIAIERIAVEWEKMIAGEFFRGSTNLIFYTDLYKYLPIIAEDNIIQEKIKHINAALPSFSAFIAYLVIYQPDITVDEWVKRWKLSNKIKKDANCLIDVMYTYRNGETSWAYYLLPMDLVDHFVLLSSLLFKTEITSVEIIERKDSFQIKSRTELAINGYSIKELFPERKPGKWIQELLTEIEKLVVAGKLKNDRIIISEWVANERNKA
ncbi:CCA tRNA nucleotidyltransferase [Gracilibacillus xinjiangensis]|uniref:CCA-adding enzyme n=1 Tax=Gracilibacillus xinjiangensis TaxID=1193282 RepID=A0ABV8X0F2_9BACI